MLQFLLFLHTLGAIAVGFYLILPFLANRLKGSSGETLKGYAKGLYLGNRISQWILVPQFLTGGYLISATGGGYSVPWMIVVVVLFVIVGAMSGMIGAPLRRISNGISNGDAASRDAGKVQTFAVIGFVVLLAEIVLMYYRDLI
ncbi:hypothetical protein [Paenibacillus turpanensis]|uniref:hypothetical protein n=1 Tax=Paenibacillus turpanensis TaxID=2689078 RepID=UPI00140AE0DE|nr:hypothetical protein [Paenibacillus turpanensis]